MNYFLEHYSKFLAVMATQDTKERGQGTLEYVGMVFVAAALVLAVVKGIGDGTKITGAISDGIDKVISNAKGS